ncbi:MAG: 50S ribosomal protein L6 [Pseudomonadota bacterium]
MSRIGKKPIEIPSGVEASVSGQTVKVKGSKGQLEVTLVDDVTVRMDDGAIVVEPRGQSKRARSMWGMSRTLVQNLVTGVTDGFTKTLEINGVGYRAQMQGANLQLQLGLSHDVLHPIPQELDVKVTKPTEIVVSGIEKQLVGQFCAEVRAYRPPEPYKGKGIKYSDETIFRKEGKKK